MIDDFIYNLHQLETIQYQQSMLPYQVCMYLELWINQSKSMVVWYHHKMLWWFWIMGYGHTQNMDTRKIESVINSFVLHSLYSILVQVQHGGHGCFFAHHSVHATRHSLTDWLISSHVPVCLMSISMIWIRSTCTTCTVFLPGEDCDDASEDWRSIPYGAFFPSLLPPLSW